MAENAENNTDREVMVYFKTPEEKKTFEVLADAYGMSAEQALVSMAKVAIMNDELSLQRHPAVREIIRY